MALGDVISNNNNAFLPFLPLVPVGLVEAYKSGVQVISDVKAASIPHLEAMAKSVYPAHEYIKNQMPLVVGGLGVVVVIKALADTIDNRVGIIRGLLTIAAGGSCTVFALCTAFPQNAILSSSAASAASAA